MRTRAPLYLLAIAGCGGSDADSAELGAGRYVIAATQFSPEGETSLVSLVDDPTSASVLDTERAIEIGGAAAIFGADGRSVFALGSSDAPVLTRYEVTPRGELVEQARMSLEGTGISSAFKRPELVPFVSDTKAYWLDDTTARAIMWNPDAMMLTGEFSLAAASRDGFTLEFGEATIRERLLFVSAQYRAADDGEAGQALALVIDTERDTLVDVLTDARCGGTVDMATGSDGTLYFASDALSATLYALGRPADYPEPCILRIRAGEQTFDPDFRIAIGELAGGRPAGRLVMGEAGQAYVLALHEELLEAPLGPETDLFAPWEASAWRWWKVELGAAKPGSVVEDAPVASAASRILRAGGHEFISQASFETGMTTLLVPQTDGSLRRGLEVLGYPYGLLQLR